MFEWKPASCPINCDSNYDCSPHAYDRGIQLKVSRQKEAAQLAAVETPVPNAYEGGNWSFDQTMQERLQSEALPVSAQRQIAGFEIAENTYYHEGHTLMQGFSNSTSGSNYTCCIENR